MTCPPHRFALRQTTGRETCIDCYREMNLVFVEVVEHGPGISWLVVIDGPGGRFTVRNALDKTSAVQAAKEIGLVLYCEVKGV